MKKSDLNISPVREWKKKKAVFISRNTKAMDREVNIYEKNHTTLNTSRLS